jgi:hypothetical protein
MSNDEQCPGCKAKQIAADHWHHRAVAAENANANLAREALEAVTRAEIAEAKIKVLEHCLKVERKGTKVLKQTTGTGRWG